MSQQTSDDAIGAALAETPAAQQLRWQIGSMSTPVDDVDFDAEDSHFHPDLLASWPRFPDEAMRRADLRRRREGMGTIDRVIEARSDDPYSIEATVETSKGKRWKLRFTVEEQPPHRFVTYPPWERVVEGVEVDVVACNDLSEAHLSLMREVFASAYRDADLEYLTDQIPAFDCVSMAKIAGEAAGFVFFGGRFAELPRLGRMYLTLGGLSCVKPTFQRMGVWDAMRMDSRIRALIPPNPDMTGVSVGRMANPASFRGFKGIPGLVPQIDTPLTTWQQDVGAAIAEAIGVEDFDPPTYVCRGRGRPVGEPVVEVEATPEEWRRFEHVDRARGDTLLAIGFWPTAPQDWDA